MKLDAIVPGDQALLYMERYVDEGAKDYSPFAARTEVAPEYQPRSHRTSFDLVTVHGEILNPKGSAFPGGPLYRARTVELVDRSQQ